MQIHEFRIGLSVYTLDADNASFYQKRGEVTQIRSRFDDTEGRIVVDFDGLPLTEFKPSELTTVKPMSFSQARVTIAELQEKVDLLEAQAIERSRQLEMARGLADEHAETIKRKDAKLKQAENQILRHETSIDALRKTNEEDRAAAESLRFEKKTLADGLAVMTHDRDTLQSLYHDSVKKRTAMQAEMEKMAQAHEATRAELVRVQGNCDLHQQRSMEKDHEIESLNQTLVHMRSCGNNLVVSSSQEVETLNSTIVSLRSQIESLQSIQESMKMMQEGHAPAMKKLQGELHKVTHQRDQHKANAVYWKELAIQHGAGVGGITADKLAPSNEARIAKIEAFLGQQFESFN